uniref:Gfo/Idh/MocA family oxidoreductase n=1 Tax=Streptomyces lushanensis TaxID=1434255 RepID=UPI0014731F78
MSAAPVRFGLVGTGWRSEFFVRLAQRLPGRLTVSGVVSRSPERAAEVEAAWGVRACLGVDELRAGPEAPEFVIPSVPWTVTPEVTKDLVRREVPVLAETPPAA